MAGSVKDGRVCWADAAVKQQSDEVKSAQKNRATVIEHPRSLTRC